MALFKDQMCEHLFLWTWCWVLVLKNIELEKLYLIFECA